MNSRGLWLGLVLLAALAPAAGAVVILNIPDPADDRELVGAVAGQKAVREFAAEIRTLAATITARRAGDHRRLLGEPAARGPGVWAMPLGQPRMFAISGLRPLDPKENKERVGFYALGDSAGVEVWYGTDGQTPRFALFYFKADKAFPKLAKVEDKAGPVRVGKPARPNCIGRDRFDGVALSSPLSRPPLARSAARMVCATVSTCALMLRTRRL